MSGAITAGYSPIRDHISDLAAVNAPTRPLMNVGFAIFTVAVASAAWPLRRVIGTPTSIALAINAALSAGVALAPLGVSPEGDRIHQAVAAAGYLALAALGHRESASTCCAVDRGNEPGGVVLSELAGIDKPNALTCDSKALHLEPVE